MKRIDVTCGYKEEYPNGQVFYYGDWSGNGMCYKDMEAWESGEGVCYIGEHEFESGYCIGNFNYQGNTREEIIADMAEHLPHCDVKFIEQSAEYVLQTCDWQCLTTLMEEVDWEEDVKESFSNGTKVIYNDKEFESKPYEIVEYESSECINLRNEYGKYTANLMDIYRKSDKFCPHCGGPLYHEKYDNTRDHYPYFCPECDENFFEIEAR